jgi:hypothetical protein
VKGRTSSTERIRFGDFKISRDHRSVTLRDQERRLTSEGFDVLMFLASHSRSLVTPQTMLETGSTVNRLGQTKFLTDEKMDRDDMVKRVVGELQFRDQFGTLKEPKSFICDVFPIRWGLYDDCNSRPEDEPALVYFGCFYLWFRSTTPGTCDE